MMIVLLVLVYLVDAFSYCATKLALLYAQPIMCMALRMLIGGTVLTTVVRFLYPEQWFMVGKTWYQYRWSWFKIIVLYLYVTYLGFFISMDAMASASVALLYNVTPLVIALFGYFLADQQMNSKKWCALILGFLSIIPITLGSHHSYTIQGNLAEVSMVLSVCALAYGWFMVHNLMQSGHSPLIINGIGMLGAGALALMTSLVCEGSLQVRWAGLKALFAFHPGTPIPDLFILMGAIICSMVAVELIFYNATAFFIRYYSIVFVSFMGNITPVIVALLNWKLFGEALPNHFILSLSTLVFSFLLFYGQELTTVFQTKRE